MCYRICLLVLTFIGMSFAATASTGAIDHRDAHNCWINCEQRGLYQGEYHPHLGPDGHHQERHKIPL